MDGGSDPLDPDSTPLKKTKSDSSGGCAPTEQGNPLSGIILAIMSCMALIGIKRK